MNLNRLGLIAAMALAAGLGTPADYGGSITRLPRIRTRRRYNRPDPWAGMAPKQPAPARANGTPERSIEANARFDANVEAGYHAILNESRPGYRKLTTNVKKLRRKIRRQLRSEAAAVKPAA